MVIGEFPIERFKNSMNLLVTLCSKKYRDIWLNKDNSLNVKALIYKGSFMECVEYLYGFIPELLKQYCRFYDIVIYKGTLSSNIGCMDVLQSLYDSGKLSSEYYTFLRKIMLTRNELIHSTLWTKDEYYIKLKWIVEQLIHSDLEGFSGYILALCDKLNEFDNNSMKSLIVKDKNSKVLVGSSSWK